MGGGGGGEGLLQFWNILCTFFGEAPHSPLLSPWCTLVLLYLVPSEMDSEPFLH